MSGSAAATLGVVSPSLIILLALSTVLMNLIRDPRADRVVRGLRPAVIVLILSAVASLGRAGIVDWTTAAIAAALFAVSVLRKTNPIYLIAAGAALGLILYPY